MKFIFDILLKMMLESIKNSASNMFNPNTFERLNSINDENTFLEILTYELCEGINNNNYKNSIKLLDLIIAYKPLKKYIIERCSKDLIYPTKANIEFNRHFNFNFNIELLESITYDNKLINSIKYYDDDFLNTTDKCLFINDVFIYDKKNDFIELLDKTINDESKLTEIISSVYKYAIIFESVNILKYMLLNYRLNEYDNKIIYKFILKPMLKSGNYEIIHLLEQQRLNFAKINYIDIYECHHYDIIEWFIINYEIKDIHNIKYTHSLMHHFLDNIELYPNIVYDYDLSCLDIIKRDIIYNNCLNIVKSNKYKYNTHDLEQAIFYHHIELFKEMLKNLSSINSLNFNILKCAINNVNIEAVKIIIDNNYMLVYQKDNNNNNIFHLIINELNELIKELKEKCYTKEYKINLINDYKESIKTLIELIKNKITRVEFDKMIKEKNLQNISAKALMEILL